MTTAEYHRGNEVGRETFQKQDNCHVKCGTDGMSCWNQNKHQSFKQRLP